MNRGQYSMRLMSFQGEQIISKHQKCMLLPQGKVYLSWWTWKYKSTDGFWKYLLSAQPVLYSWACSTLGCWPQEKREGKILHTETWGNFSFIYTGHSPQRLKSDLEIQTTPVTGTFSTILSLGKQLLETLKAQNFLPRGAQCPVSFLTSSLLQTSSLLNTKVLFVWGYSELKVCSSREESKGCFCISLPKMPGRERKTKTKNKILQLHSHLKQSNKHFS